MKHWDDRDASSGRWALYFEEEDMRRGVKPEIILIKQKEGGLDSYNLLFSCGKPNYKQQPLKATTIDAAKKEAEMFALKEYEKEVKGYEREVSVFQKKIDILKGEKSE